VHNDCDLDDLADGWKKLDDNTVIGVYGTKYEIQDDGTLLNVGSASTDEIATAGVQVIARPNVEFPNMSISDAQWGKKISYHMRDFDLDVSNPKDRETFRIFVENIGGSPDQVTSGKFRGLGSNGTIGDALFYIKNNDVVVTTPNGQFVTILENGLNNNRFVRESLK